MRGALRSWMSACLVAVTFTGTILLLRLALSNWLDQQVPLVVGLFTAVVATAGYGGFRAGLLTTAFCLVVVITSLNDRSPGEMALRIVSCLVEGLAISFCFEAMHRARHRLEKKKTQLEEEVRRRLEVEQELVAAARRKNEFLATLAHELRNPLAPLSNCLELLRRAGHDPSALAQARPIMERQVNQMVRLVDDLLDVARLDRNKLELRKERVPLSEIVQKAVETSRPLIDAKAHHLTITLPPEPILLHADAVRVTQVLSNLLNNAAKYTDPGGHIELSAEPDASEVVVKVRDTGIGIPADMLPKVFEMFTQADQGLERSQGGLGIGLTLVKWLVEMHGGSVEARSDGPGRGSELVVRLPALSSTAPEAQRSTGVSNGPAAGVRRRILVVDDNEDVVTTLGTMLTGMGNEVCTANDGVEAVTAAASFQPDVVFLDLRMPRLNGYDAARRIREQSWGKEMVLIAHSGWGQEADRRRSAEAGFDSHLIKPVAATALLELLAGLRPTKSTR